MEKRKVTKLRIDAYRYTKTSAALQLPVEFVTLPPGVGGALVKNKMLYLPKDADYKQYLMTYCHELLHLIFNHIPRGQGKRFDVWGIAIDHVVNYMLVNILKVISNNEISKYGMILFNSSVPEGPAELIYRMLLKKIEDAEKNGKDSFKFGGAKINIVNGGVGNHREAEVDGKNKTRHGQEVKEQPEVGQGSLTEFENAMKSQGNLPGGVLREIENGFKPQVNWPKILSSRIMSFIGTKISTPTYTKIPYYQLGMRQQIRLPSVYKKQFSLVTAFDTSGSISVSELSKFLTELDVCRKYLSDLWTYIIDAKIHAVLHNPTREEILKNLKGNGGTDLSLVFTDIEKKKIKPQLLVYFTDTYGTFPEKHPSYPVIWIVVKSFQTVTAPSVPFGTIYYIE